MEKIINSLKNFLDNNKKIKNKEKKIIKEIIEIINNRIKRLPKKGLFEDTYIESFKYGTNKVLRSDNYIRLASGNVAKLSDILTEEDNIFIDKPTMDIIMKIDKDKTNPNYLQKYISSEEGKSNYHKFGCDWSSDINPIGRNLCGESWMQSKCGDCWLMSSYEVSFTSCLIKYIYQNPSEKKLPQALNLSYMSWAGSNTPRVSDFLPTGEESKVYFSESCKGGFPTTAIQCQQLYGIMSDDYASNNYIDDKGNPIKKNEELTMSSITKKSTFCNLKKTVCYNFNNQQTSLKGGKTIISTSPSIVKMLDTDYEYKWVDTVYSKDDNISLRKNISNSFVCNHLLTVGPIQIMVNIDSFVKRLIPLINGKLNILAKNKKPVFVKIKNNISIIQDNSGGETFDFLKFGLSKDDILILTTPNNGNKTEFKTIARQIKSISSDEISFYKHFSSEEIGFNQSYFIIYQKKLDMYKQFFKFPDENGNYKNDNQPYGFVNTDAFKTGKNLNHALKLVGCVKGYDEKQNKINLWVFRNRWGSPYGYNGNIYVKQGTTLDDSVYEAIFLSPSDFQTDFLKDYNCENNYEMWNNLNKESYNIKIFGRDFYYSLS